MSDRRTWFQRNEQAEQLETEGRFDEALALYEANEQEGCDISFTYARMAAIYRNRGEHEQEVQALQKAVAIEQERGPSSRLVRLQRQLERSHHLEKRARRTARRPAPSSATGVVGGASTKKNKGCLSAVLLVAAGGLMASLL